MKKKMILCALVSFGIMCGSLKTTSNAKYVRDVVENYKECVSEAFEVYEEKYSNSLEYYDYEINDSKVTTMLNDDVDYDLENWEISVNNVYEDLTDDEKAELLKINQEEPDFSEAYSLLIGENNSEYKINSTNNRNKIGGISTYSVNKRGFNFKNNLSIMLAGTLTLGGVAVSEAVMALYNTISSIFVGVQASSYIPFIGWGIACSLILAVVIIVAYNWTTIKETFKYFVEEVKSTFSRIANLISEVAKKGEDEGKKNDENPDVAEDASRPSKLQGEITREQAPKGVTAAHGPHDKYGKPHVHFGKDESGLNWDGTWHDEGGKKKLPNVTRKILDWLQGHGWCQNGVKEP